MPKSKSHGRRKRQELALEGLMREADDYEARTGYSMFDGTFTPRVGRVAAEIRSLRRKLSLPPIERDRRSQ